MARHTGVHRYRGNQAQLSDKSDAHRSKAVIRELARP
jgi:hypothetical protein